MPMLRLSIEVANFLPIHLPIRGTLLVGFSTISFLRGNFGRVGTAGTLTPPCWRLAEEPEAPPPNSRLALLPLRRRKPAMGAAAEAAAEAAALEEVVECRLPLSLPKKKTPRSKQK